MTIHTYNTYRLLYNSSILSYSMGVCVCATYSLLGTPVYMLYQVCRLWLCGIKLYLYTCVHVVFGVVHKDIYRRLCDGSTKGHACVKAEIQKIKDVC